MNYHLTEKTDPETIAETWEKITLNKIFYVSRRLNIEKDFCFSNFF